MFSRGVLSVALFALAALVVALPAAQATPTNVRLTNDNGSNGGYVSDYTMVTGTPYTDAFLTACSQSRGRQNEPAVAVDPRNPQVIVGSSNDYCGVLAAGGRFVGVGDRLLCLHPGEGWGARLWRAGLPG